MRPGARASGLPLNLERYNVVYMAAVSAIVLSGTAYSVVYMTHHYNVMLSDPTGSIAQAMRAGPDGEALNASHHMPRIPGTFLADRRNLVNRVFVKLAWMWTTVAFLAQAFTLRNFSTTTASSSSPTLAGSANTAGKRRLSDGSGAAAGDKRQGATQDPAGLQATVMGAASISLLRYCVATALWLLFARWFFGPPLMERVRHYSGAVCAPVGSGAQGSIVGPGAATSSTSGSLGSLLPSAIDARLCYTGGRTLSPKTQPELFAAAGFDSSKTDGTTPGGTLRAVWRGGHDISGHTFILIISSLYLLEEVTPFLPYLLPISLQRHALRLLPRPLWAPADPFTAAGAGSPQQARVNYVVALAILGLVGVWMLSLTVTSIFFHTPQEKISGLLLALAASTVIPKGG